jgi:phosphoglycolate phosphatase-like HAD superfamily hydrolase
VGSSRHLAAAFDFDRTLAIKHVGPFDLGNDVVDRIFGGQERVDILASLLKELAQANCKCYVITRNSAHVVHKALTAIGIRDYFLQIIGNETFDFGERKSGIIDAYILEPSKLTPADVIFIDDDAREVKDVQQVVGCTSVRAAYDPPTGGGMSAKDCQAVRDWLAEA